MKIFYLQVNEGFYNIFIEEKNIGIYRFFK